MAKLVYLQRDNYPSSGHAVKPHKHSCWEGVYYINSRGSSNLYGKSDTSLNAKRILYCARTDIEKTITFTSNQIILYEPHMVHDETISPFASANSEKQVVISFGFLPDADLPEPLMGVYDDKGLVVYHMLNDLISEYENQQFCYGHAMDHIVSRILIQLLRRTRSAKSGGDLQYILHYIDEYFPTKLNVEKLARMANYSPSQFRKVFADQTGTSPKRYILKKRVTEAKYLIRYSSLPFTEIAAQCGFEDYNQFQVFFKKETGSSPSAYRRS